MATANNDVRMPIVMGEHHDPRDYNASPSFEGMTEEQYEYVLALQKRLAYLAGRAESMAIINRLRVEHIRKLEAGVSAACEYIQESYEGCPPGFDRTDCGMTLDCAICWRKMLIGDCDAIAEKEKQYEKTTD